jgi:tetratricopeptide (TPR) repeat protein
MYTTTFYSFKGGVGRTMALLNCATELAQRGRRVLLVDFDLEAPGIPTFEGFSGANDSPGIVDYVSDYLARGTAPTVEKYIFRSETFDAAGGCVWLMSAGKQDPAYSAKLHAIDWQHLYDKHAGFLLFEDLKAQWKETLSPDYVFIDSRTGHTDEGGICTRQLPDAVCFLFFPNDQNLVGLSTLLEDVRSEAKPPRGKVIDLHFVPSNVPNLDDEEGILRHRIARFRDTLQYKEPSATIHHYNSLVLLNQTIFTKHRRSTQLSREYQELTEAIIAKNLRDRDAAIGALTEFQAALGRPGREYEVSVHDIEEKLEKISENHSADGEIQYRMGIVRMRMGELPEAESLLSNAIKLGHTLPALYMNRATCHRAMGNDRAAVADISEVLRRESVSERDFMFATRWLIDLDPSLAHQVEEAPALDRLKPNVKLQLATDMMRSRKALPTLIFILRRWKQLIPDKQLEISIRTRLILSLIALRRYRDAITEIEQLPRSTQEHEAVAEAFNYAIAIWGEKDVPSRELFQTVADLHRRGEGKGGPNYHQCMALTFWILGEERMAREHLDQSKLFPTANPKTQFSCWRYLEASPAEFYADVSKMEHLLRGGPVAPEFMTEPPEVELLLTNGIKLN